MHRQTVLMVDRIIALPMLAAARATASSPSGWHRRCMAMGATNTGQDSLRPADSGAQCVMQLAGKCLA